MLLKVGSISWIYGRNRISRAARAGELAMAKDPNYMINGTNGNTALVDSLPSEEFELELPVRRGGARMTHQELLAMKVSTSRVEEPRVQLVQGCLGMLLKSALTVKAWFTLKEPRRKVCQQIGHECANCGMRVSFDHEAKEHPHRS